MCYHHHHHQHSHDNGGLDDVSLGKHHEDVVVSHECHEHHQDNQHCCSDSFSEDRTRKNSECHAHHNHAHHHDPPGHSHSYDSRGCADNHDHNHHHNDHSDYHIHGSHQHNFSRNSHTAFLEDPKGGKSHDHQSTGSHGRTHCSDRSQQSKLSSDVKEPMKQRHLHIDHNMEGIFLHVLADTMGSVGVVISTLLIRVPRAHEQSLRMAITDVKKMKGVSGIQNLHIWSFTNTDVGTLHLHISEDADKASIKAQVSHILQDAGIKDLTLQVECIKLRRIQF